MNTYYLFLLVAISYTITLSAQTIDATLIEINSADDSNPRYLTAHNNKLYFTASPKHWVRELWSYDIITKKAKSIKNINPEDPFALDNNRLVFVDDILFFLASDGQHGQELWRSDGTEIGTYMVKDINSVTGSSIDNMINYEGKLVFSANDNINGKELWISDGEESGTYMLKDINPGAGSSNISDIFEFNEKIYFTAENGTQGREIWMSDGTPAGTEMLLDLNPNGNGVHKGNKFIIFKNHFYFFNYKNYYESNLWRSDGTISGTTLVTEINFSPGIIYGIASSDFFVFAAKTQEFGNELWVSDGTSSGTKLLKDIFPGYINGIDLQSRFALLNEKVLFTARDDVHGTEIWTTDGTSTGTQLVKDIFPGIESSEIVKMTSTNEFVIFSAKEDYNAYHSLWKSDGTEAGTLKVKNIDLNKDYGYTIEFIPINNKIYFQGADKTINGIEIWETDGTTENTKLTVDINHSGSSSPNGTLRYLTPLNDKFIMMCTNGFNGVEPFITDGTFGSTQMIKDIFPGYNSSLPTSDNKKFYFKKVGDYVYFAANDGSNGIELFRTDGTEEGTILVKDIALGSASSLTSDLLYMEYNDIFYFKADDKIHGGEIWRTDGTEAGTYMLKDIYPGPNHGIQTSNNHEYGINHNAVVNGFLYFNADDGTENAIWKTDGTENGTVKAISIPSSGNHDRGPIILNGADGKLYFLTNPDNHFEPLTLNVSDGTQSNITTLGTWLASGYFENNIIHNNELYFFVPDGHDLALMKTDGTINGTKMVKSGITREIKIRHMGSCEDYIYFSVGPSFFSAKELWRSDGTPEGTHIIDSGYISGYTCIGKKLAYTNSFEAFITDGYNKEKINLNILNGEPVGNVSSIDGFFDKKLYFTAETRASGYEFYGADADEILKTNNPEVQNSSIENIKIYPNPTNGHFTILSKNSLNIDAIDIFDFSGKKIFSQIPNKNLVNLDITQFSKGLYIIKIKTHKSVVTQKILLK
ncbi:MAG TPA: ELWxxDGT repeat protein [Aequorivita sp.]|nr:ELWxxDGT repeat protein [Aequorivita sp.]